MPELTQGRTVIYRSKTGDYTLPAIVAQTVETLNPRGVELFAQSGGKRGVPPLSSPDHAHLVVLTAGIPVAGPNLRDEEPIRENEFGSMNLCGVYQEWDVAEWLPTAQTFAQAAVPGAVPPPPGVQDPGTWMWPVIR